MDSFLMQDRRQIMSSASFKFRGFFLESFLETKASPSQVSPWLAVSVKRSSRMDNSWEIDREVSIGSDSDEGALRLTPSSRMESILATRQLVQLVEREHTEKKRTSRETHTQNLRNQELR